MWFVKVNPANNLPLEVKESSPIEVDRCDPSWKCRWDWSSFAEVERIATYVTAMTGETYLAVDSGDGVFPRFDIILAPKVGTPVSYCFNGDCYPDGTIAKITKSFNVHTSNGTVYRRRKKTGAWLKSGGTWGLTFGHHSYLNPHF